MNIKHLLATSLAVLLSACNNQNNSVPIKSDSGYSDEYSDGYQNQYQNTPIATTDALAVGAVGVATGYALAKQANKPRYSKPKASYGKTSVVYGKPVVVGNNHHYQTKPKVRVSRYKRK